MSNKPRSTPTPLDAINNICREQTALLAARELELTELRSKLAEKSARESAEVVQALAERDARITELQHGQSSLVLENRALKRGRSKLSGQVQAFMHAFDQPTRETPGLPTGVVLPNGETWTTEQILRLRFELPTEELGELLAAGFGDDREIKSLIIGLVDHIRNKPLHIDLPRVIDALGDLDYVNEGFRLTVGVSGDPIADEIHDANMAKVGGPLDPVTGKKLKPPGWLPPNIERCLYAQGW